MDPLSLASRLVAVPSVNPMGGPPDDDCFETRMTSELVTLFSQAGVAFEIHEVLPGRSNVLARFESAPDRPTLLWEAHQDTVPVTGMTIPPFEPQVADGRLYGRGACDVKGGMAAMLSAFFRLVSERPTGAANVVMACTCDEESTATGVGRLAELWTSRRGVSPILSEPPAAAIVAEPTSLDVVVAHKGVTRWEIITRGRACHSSAPQDGVNAIYRMARVVSALEDAAASLAAARPPHPLCGSATLSVGRITGGQSVNIVPEECRIEIDRRSIPGEDPQEILQETMGAVRSRLDFDLETSPPWLISPPLSDADNGPLAKALLDSIQSFAGPRRSLGVAYGTDAAAISAAGVPCVVFGPGSIAQAHTADEWLPIEELTAASDILFHFAANFPGERTT